MVPPETVQPKSRVQIALRTAGLYLAFGLVWKLLSDLAVSKLATSRDELVKLETAKGWLFIGATSVLLFWLLKRELASWEREAVSRSQAENDLRLSNARFKSLFENMMNGIAHCRVEYDGDVAVDFTYLNVNRSFYEQTGLRDVVGKKATEVIPGIRESDPHLLALYGRVASVRSPEHVEMFVAALRQWFSLSVYSPNPGEFVAVFDVITARKRVEEELRTFSRAIEQSPASIVITDPDGAIRYVNPRFTLVTGYSPAEVLGKNPRMLNSGKGTPTDFKEMWATILAGREWSGEFCNRKKNGEIYWERATVSPVFGDSGAITHFVAVKADITGERQLEEQARRSQRMDAIGSLASGIAHDLNNILAPVLMVPELLKPTLKSTEELHLLELVEQSAHRARALVKQLLLFGRGGAGGLESIDPQVLLNEIRIIISETFRRDIALTVTSEANLHPLLGDPTQLHQVLLNLCVNARDAMPEGGALAVHASNAMVDTELSRANALSKVGPHVHFTVKDSGVGMTPEVVERIFTPFFSTKEIGKGTGLGLSTALGIVRRHGGFMTVDSLPGEGSVFHVYLPAACVVAPAAAAAPLALARRGNNELILVVDDESFIADETRRVLDSNGYRTIVATRGDAGLAMFRSHPDEVSLVITDIMMPVMNGLAMVRQIHAIRPDARVVVTTGEGSGAQLEDCLKLGVCEVISKPYKPNDLLEVVKRALGSKKA